MGPGAIERVGSSVPWRTTRALVERLRAGDEDAFNSLVARHDGALRRIARTFVRTDSAADDVVQDTWLGVVRGLSGFEGRSSLRTWIFRILVNQARTRATRDARSLPFSALGEDDAAGRRADGLRQRRTLDQRPRAARERPGDGPAER